eukprot:scaffold114541_cov33-Tisochrysis_lutea.AAC.2
MRHRGLALGHPLNVSERALVDGCAPYFPGSLALGMIRSRATHQGKCKTNQLNVAIDPSYG